MKLTHCTASLLVTVVLQISAATELVVRELVALVVQVVQVALTVQVGRAVNQEQLTSPVRSLLTEGVGDCNANIVIYINFQSLDTMST